TGVNLANDDNFGASVSLNGLGNILAVAAHRDDTGGTDRGAVYLFNLNPNDLTQEAVFRQKLSHGTAGISLADSDSFGLRIDLNDAGNMLAVGAYVDDTGGTDRGALYLLELDETNLAA